MGGTEGSLLPTHWQHFDEYEVTCLAAGDSHDASLTSQFGNSVSGVFEWLAWVSTDCAKWVAPKVVYCQTYDECEVKLLVLLQ